MSMRTLIYCSVLAVFFFNACKKTGDDEAAHAVSPVDTTEALAPYKLVLPPGFPAMKIPPENLLTVEGVALGKKLFYDNILSADHSTSCGSCHKQHISFVDDEKFSTGINGGVGLRNAMPLFNLAWAEFFNPTVHRFMWDGTSTGMEEQVLLPIRNPLELGNSLLVLERNLRNHPTYPALFKRAFGIDSITIKYVGYAIAQFERTLISGSSKYDKYRQGLTDLTEEELNGLNVFSREDKGGCFHCHGNDRSPFFTDFRFHNNGLDSLPFDKGLGAVTNDPNDNGLFKTPSLRNLAFTAPYMHDGRFSTLEEVIEHYNNDVKVGPTTDANLVQHVKSGGLKLTEKDKRDLIAFINTLNDYEFLVDKRFGE